jgi:hypothetical protein
LWKYKIAGLVTPGELDKLDQQWDMMLRETAHALGDSDAPDDGCKPSGGSSKSWQQRLMI